MVILIGKEHWGHESVWCNADLATDTFQTASCPWEGARNPTTSCYLQTLCPSPWRQLWLFINHKVLWPLHFYSPLLLHADYNQVSRARCQMKCRQWNFVSFNKTVFTYTTMQYRISQLSVLHTWFWRKEGACRTWWCLFHSHGQCLQAALPQLVDMFSFDDSPPFHVQD